MKAIYHIARDEPFPNMYENADFSPEMIKNSIKEGDMRTTKLWMSNKINSKLEIFFNDMRFTIYNLNNNIFLSFNDKYELISYYYIYTTSDRYKIDLGPCHLFRKLQYTIS